MTVAALEAITITARIIAMMNVVRDVVLVFLLVFFVGVFGGVAVGVVGVAEVVGVCVPLLNNDCVPWNRDCECGRGCGAANGESRAGAGGARGSASRAYFRLPVSGWPHIAALGKPHTVHVCAGALQFMPMRLLSSLSWVGGAGAAGLGHAMMASSFGCAGGVLA